VQVAVTGAAGQIGSTLCPGLASRGHDVIGLDLVGSADVEQVDVRDSAVLTPLLAGCDAVVHLAAKPHETTFEDTLDTHLRTTHSVLDAMLAVGVNRIVYASSNHAVGFTPRAQLVSVGTRPRPDTFYGMGIVYGISANTRAWWDLEPARALDYRPQDDAEDFAAEVLATPETADDRFAALHVGGEFCHSSWAG
jgi:nucleoside-diphosphate-sugar epimerase